MNGLIYTRVSTKEQVEDRTSLAAQERECSAFARKQGIQVVEECIFREKGESAKITDRTELQKLLEYVRKNKGKAEILYIWKIDRLSRNLGDYYGIKVALNRYGVKIVSVTEPIDDDPVGRFLEAILAAAAQFDNEIRAIRTLSGMRIRVEQGEWPHSVAIGYKKQDRRVVVDPEYGAIISDILTRFSEGGHSIADICHYAFERGIKTRSGKQKSHEAMKIILKNPIYAGFTKSKLAPELTKGRHKPLVDIAVIKKNIDLIDGNKRNYFFQGDDLYPLKNILCCANCKLKLTASHPRSQNGQYFNLYHCNRKTCRKRVTGKRASIDVDIAHKHFRELLETLRPLDEGIARLYKKFVVAAWNRQYKKSLETLAEVNREIERYKSLRHATTTKFIEDKISEQDRDMQHAQLDAKLAESNRELEEVQEYVEENEKIIDKAMQFIETPDLFWNHAKTDVKQLIQLFLFPNGVAYDFETGFGTFKKLESHLLIKKMADKSANNSDLVAATGIEPVTLGL